MNRNAILAQMRQRIELDASGNQLAELVKEQKELGLTKVDAQKLLTLLLNEYQGITPRTAVVEEKEDGIAGVLDRVLGWCSHNHIYTDEQEAG